MPKIYVPTRGFVFTADQTEIDMLLAEGGRVVIKNREIDQPIDDLIADPVPALHKGPVPEPTPIGLAYETAEPLPAVIKPKHRSRLK